MPKEQVIQLEGYTAGYLQKQGFCIKTWKRRFFSFQDGILSYRKDRKETSKVLKSDVVVAVRFHARTKHGLYVRLGSGRDLLLSAATEDIANTWHDVLEEYINKKKKHHVYEDYETLEFDYDNLRIHSLSISPQPNDSSTPMD